MSDARENRKVYRLLWAFLSVDEVEGKKDVAQPARLPDDECSLEKAARGVWEAAGQCRRLKTTCQLKLLDLPVAPVHWGVPSAAAWEEASTAVAAVLVEEGCCQDSFMLM